jgi:hypothetical protein
MGVYANNGIVFNAATTDWSRVLASGEPHVETITDNVLRRLGAGDTKHPVAQAWHQLYSEQVGANVVEILREGRKSCIYRLSGVGPNDTAVIAKRCRTQGAEVERTIYEEILPSLSISKLGFYGYVDEPATGYGWIFVEDAGGEEFDYSIQTHRRLAARWLGQMHTAAESNPGVSRLPDRGPQYYLGHLRSSRELIQSKIGDPALQPEDVRVLESVILQSNILESQWERVEKLCRCYPQTLVHGDFSYQNIRVRPSESGLKLLAFDWEMAGYGVPGPDLAEITGRGTDRSFGVGALPDAELADYWSVVQEAWPQLDFPAIKRLADLGAVLRLVIAISWESLAIRRGWWPIEELRGYQANLTVALRNLDLT